MSSAKADLHADRFRRLLEVGLGPELRAGVEDEDVVEILVNPDGSLWFDRHSSGLGQVATLPAERIRSLAASVATFYGKTITPDSPILEANLPFHGARFEAVAQPVSPEGTILSLRKKHRIYRLETDFLGKGVITDEQESLLRDAVARHANLILCRSHVQLHSRVARPQKSESATGRRAADQEASAWSKLSRIC